MKTKRTKKTHISKVIQFMSFERFVRICFVFYSLIQINERENVRSRKPRKCIENIEITTSNILNRCICTKRTIHVYKND